MDILAVSRRLATDSLFLDGPFPTAFPKGVDVDMDSDMEVPGLSGRILEHLDESFSKPGPLSVSVGYMYANVSGTPAEKQTWEHPGADAEVEADVIPTTVEGVILQSDEDRAAVATQPGWAQVVEGAMSRLRQMQAEGSGPFEQGDPDPPERDRDDW